MASRWHVTPASLLRARQEALKTQDDLARASGISVRSIRSYERDEQPVQLTTLQCLAKALAVDVKRIGVLKSPEGKAASARPPPAAAPTEPASVLPPRTQLETLVDLERAAGVTASFVDTPRGRAETLTAKRLQDVLTAYALYDGARFTIEGRVTGMRGIAPSEAKLLGSRNGVAARFHVVKEVVPGQVVGVTVHTAERAHTEGLQKLYEKQAALVLRVLLVPGEPVDDGPGFSSFITRLTVKRPWTFVVEEVAEAGDGAERKAAKAGRKKGKGG